LASQFVGNHWGLAGNGRNHSYPHSPPLYRFHQGAPPNGGRVVIPSPSRSGNRLPRLGAPADLCLQSLPLLSQGFASRNFRLIGPHRFRPSWVLFWQRRLVHSNSWQRWPNLGGQYRGALDRLRHHWTGCRLVFGHTGERVPVVRNFLSFENYMCVCHFVDMGMRRP
jgi:hypothetical protein